MQNLFEQYKSIKPDANWVKNTEKQLKANMPKSNWPIYSGVLVLALALSLGLVLYESPEQKPIKIIQEPVTQQEVVQAIQKATKTAKKIEEKIQEKILAVKTETSQQDEISPLVKLLEDLEKAKITRETLEEIEKDIENGDFVIARQKLDKLLKNDNLDNMDSLQVDSEKN